MFKIICLFSIVLNLFVSIFTLCFVSFVFGRRTVSEDEDATRIDSRDIDIPEIKFPDFEFSVD